MKTNVSLCAFLLVVGITFSGCATGPKFSEVRGALPPLSPNEGRIYIYRTTVLGAAIQPDVKVDGEVVGTAKPKGFFLVDRAPGNHKVSCSTEVERTLSLTLEKGQVQYVRLGVTIGLIVAHVYPELVEPGEGEKGLKDCSYTGAGQAK